MVTSSAPGVADAITRVRHRIANAAERSGRAAADIRLIAVTKGVPAERVNEALGAGIGDIGENRVQEALSKRAHVSAKATWHLIGHLQTNKAKAAAGMFNAVHSVDSERIARELARHRPMDTEPIAALIEVELTGIAGRTGVAEADAAELLHRAAALPGLHIMGLMTIAPPVQETEDARPYFVRLRGLRDRLEASSGWPLPHLSMGMSDDFEVAVEEGATMVRVGRAIFGERS